MQYYGQWIISIPVIGQVEEKWKMKQTMLPPEIKRPEEK